MKNYSLVAVAVLTLFFNFSLFAQPTNDECSTAIPLIVNSGIYCENYTYGTISGATASIQVNTCVGNDNDDVWFQFTPTTSRYIISLYNINGTTQHLNFGLFTGQCGSLTQVICEVDLSLNIDYSSYVIGQDYYVRVWSNGATATNTSFDVCVKSISNCQNAEYFCGSTANDPYIFPNTTGIISSGQVACLGSIPNPTYYTLKVTESGPLLYNILQNTSFDGLGNATGSNMDVDFVAWGPFTSADNCDQIVFGDCPTCPFDNFTPPADTFYPFGNIVDCSYSTSFTETLSIPNAIAGEYYKILITNFNGGGGFIKLDQTNFSDPNSGKTRCSDKLLLVAFIDVNANGIKDLNETNFTFGTFNYQVNNTGATTSVTSQYGKYDIFDTNPSNTYDVSYQIYPEYAAYYTLTATNFNDINIPTDGGTQTLFFPVTVIQGYNDVAVSIISMNNPVAGSTYINKIVYKNLGVIPASGTLTFNKDLAVSISAISQSGVVNNADGFTYNFVNLPPYGSRSITVEMSIPPIPIVNINDMITTSCNVTGLSGDIDLTNNSFTNSRIVAAAYDPNDKIESHGKQILITDFDTNDYLYYTIRFQNTGTSNAINVRLEDFLDAQLDSQSIRIIEASHNYTMERINNQLVWKFENIQLKPALENDVLSKGYVTFKIKPTPGFSVGNIIPNTASIYFDSNPAIVTNTFETEFVETLGTNSFNANTIAIYPNPANSSVRISDRNGLEKISAIYVYDVVGKEILFHSNIESSEVNLDVSKLNKGVYFVEITTKNQLKIIKKLLIQ
jgi:uncharacterized repeat protein (TIGR01451 family)